ncbi:hypothetical protein [Saccharothrix sp.]|uniref:hypothetical protein n=1 Tax=Saccharothrix sp. TaxID=1873460 RepID=UPI0028113216|nr:hypothetical protein [Saccharothrix sp.]
MNPPLVIGNVIPARHANPSNAHGVDPTRTSPHATAASTNWLPANAITGRRVRSSHAPSNGPDRIDGIV